MEDCLFCKITSGAIPCSKIFENDRVLAFDDIHPIAPVHVVVIPKDHIPTLLDVKPETMESFNAVIAAVQEVARIKGIDQRGFKTVINTNKEGGQVIFHLHVHVLGGGNIKLEKL
jgi:histidine triad (HIT) family protein